MTDDWHSVWFLLSQLKCLDIKESHTAGKILKIDAEWNPGWHVWRSTFDLAAGANMDDEDFTQYYFLKYFFHYVSDLKTFKTWAETT